MAGMNPGFAKYLAEKKAGTLSSKQPVSTQQSSTVQSSGFPGMHVQLAGAVPKGKRHSKVKIHKKK